MKKVYWLYAEPDDNKIQETEEEKKNRLAKEASDRELIEKITKSLEEKYSNKINELETKIKEMQKQPEPPEVKEKDKEIPKPTGNEEILKVMQETNKMFINNKKSELIKKYNLTDEDLSSYNTLDALNEAEKVYESAFKKAEAIYTSEEKMVEALKKKKKMIVDLDNGLGEAKQRENQEKKTKSIMDFLSRRK